MTIQTQEIKFSLPTDLITEMDAVVSKGQAPSRNALVEQALVKALDEYRRQERQAIMVADGSKPGPSE